MCIGTRLGAEFDGEYAAKLALARCSYRFAHIASAFAP